MKVTGLVATNSKQKGRAALSVGFGYAEPNAVSNAVDYAKFRSRSYPAVILVYDAAASEVGTQVPRIGLLIT